MSGMTQDPSSMARPTSQLLPLITSSGVDGKSPGAPGDLQLARRWASMAIAQPFSRGRPVEHGTLVTVPA